MLEINTMKTIRMVVEHIHSDLICDIEYLRVLIIHAAAAKVVVYSQISLL